MVWVLQGINMAVENACMGLLKLLCLLLQQIPKYYRCLDRKDLGNKEQDEEQETLQTTYSIQYIRNTPL